MLKNGQQSTVNALTGPMCQSTTHRSQIIFNPLSTIHYLLSSIICSAIFSKPLSVVL